jgi:hypothetical protein
LYNCTKSTPGPFTEKTKERERGEKWQLAYDNGTNTTPPPHLYVQEKPFCLGEKPKWHY